MEHAMQKSIWSSPDMFYGLGTPVTSMTQDFGSSNQKTIREITSEAFYRAIRWGFLDMVEITYEMCVDLKINLDLGHALFVSEFRGRYDVAKYLISIGARG